MKKIIVIIIAVIQISTSWTAEKKENQSCQNIGKPTDFQTLYWRYCVEWAKMPNMTPEKYYETLFPREDSPEIRQAITAIMQHVEKGKTNTLKIVSKA